LVAGEADQHGEGDGGDTRGQEGEQVAHASAGHVDHPQPDRQEDDRRAQVRLDEHETRRQRRETERDEKAPRRAHAAAVVR